MKKTIIENAPAKINLTLDITGIREDGYHNIDSIMQSVSLCDVIELTFDSEGEGVTLSAASPELPSGADNICHKAASSFLAASGIRGGVDIRLTKRIPVSAGLGGGSSDAAAVLRALNRSSGCPLDAGRLLETAARLGADIPFCLSGGCMRARGIGELLTPLPPLPDCHIVIVRSGSGVSSAEAYRLFDAEPVFTGKSADFISAANNLTELAPYFGNAFEPVIFKLRPEAKQLCSELTSLGALVSHMSGSGDAVYAIFSEEATAQRACSGLQKRGVFAALCRPCR